MSRPEGFKDQVLHVIPPEFYNNSDRLTKQLYITDIGYFPKAEDHWISRNEGCCSSILIICTGGSGYLETKDYNGRVAPGEAVIISPGIPHSYGSAAGTFWEIFWVHFSGEMAVELQYNLSGSKKCFPFQLIPGDESMELFSEICSTLSEGLSPLKYELICSRFWHLGGSLTADKKHGNGTSAGLVTKCMEVIEENLKGSLSLEQLSSKVSVTPQYLCRLFKQKTGQSPIEYYNQLKIQRARGLLDMTSLRINEISAGLGFNDPYYFTRVFKRIMGISPRDYRNRQI